MKISISVSKTKGYLVFIIWLAHLSLAWADTVDPIRSMPQHPVGHTDLVWSVAISPDGRYALSGSRDNTLKLWNVSSGAEIRTFQGHTDSVRSVAFSPDGRYALSGSDDKTLKLWKVSNGAEIRTFQGHTSSVYSVAFSPDGLYALSGSNGTLKLWEVSSGAEIRTFQRHTNSVSSVAFSPDGRYALSGSLDRTLKLWEVSSGDEIRSFQGHTDFVRSVAFSPDGRYALSGSLDKTLKLWEVSSGDEIRSFQGHTASVYSVAFSPDGRYALSGSHDKTLKLWEVSSGDEIRTFQGHISSIMSVAFSPDGLKAISGSMDTSLKLWEVSSGAEIRSLSPHHILAIAISPDGRYALSGSQDKTLKLWEVSSGAEIRTFQGHTAIVRSVAFSLDGKYALSGSEDKTLKLWEVSSGDEIRTFQGHTDIVWSVAFSPDGDNALSGSKDNTLKLWEVSSGAEIRTFQGHTNSVGSVAFSPDGRYALSGSSDLTLKLWEVSSGAEIRTFQGHTDSVSSVAFSPEGDYALSGSKDNTLKLWKVSSGDEIRSFQGHTDWVWSVAFSADGGYALSGSSDLLKLWEVSSGTEIRTFHGHTNHIFSVAFSPDGRYAFSGSYDRTLKMWETGIPMINKRPQAAFTVSPTQGQIPLTVHLDASASYDPDGSIVKYEWAVNGEPFAYGNPFSYTFTTAFEYQGSITLTVTDNQGNTASTQQNVSITVTAPPTDSVGQAIIIAGPRINDTLFQYSNEFSQRMYRLLKKRRFGDDDVHYMNLRAPDIELDGLPENERQDYNFFEPEQQLSQAFAQAAARLSAGQQFVFYLHGHGRKNRVYLSDYELSASHLRDLLATLPAGTQQIIIIDTCYSGSFFDELAGVENRVVISSADDRQLAWQTTVGSFADKFLRLLEHGSNVDEAFRLAEDMILKNPTDFNDQRPWLDDNGDGQYLHNDGTLAANIYIGGEGISQAPPPKITQVHPRRTLPENVSTTTLWVKTSPSGSSGNIYENKVQAVLINPNYVLNEYQGEATNFSRLEIALTYNPAQDRFEAVYDKFCTAGLWRIFYQVQDTDGVWSEIATGEVQTQGCSLPATIKMELNQSRYTTNELLRLDMTVNGQAVVDLYVVIVFPAGYFQTIAYPLNFGLVGAAQTYQPNVEIAGVKTYSIMNFSLPAGVGLGQYNACGVMVTPDALPLDQDHWIHVDCAEFEVY